MGNTISKELKSSVEMHICGILSKVFPNDSVRQKIYRYSDRLNFACPVCGDSAVERHKKRGNLYWSDMGYHCYNCGYHASVNRFFNDFGETLDTEHRLEVIDIKNNISRKKISISDDGWVSKLIHSLGIPRDVFLSKNKFIDTHKNSKCTEYLLNRKIPKSCYDNFAYDVWHNRLVVMNMFDNKVIGYQTRALSNDMIGCKYLSYNISKMFTSITDKPFDKIVSKMMEKMGICNIIEQEDGIENIVERLNTLSMIFNVMNVDFSKKLYVVEGPIDSFFIKNCVALCGATKLKNYFDGVEDLVYLFDNDKTGASHTIEKLKEGKCVFLWSKFINDNNNIKVKDVNDVFVKLGDNNCILNEKYTSSNSLDIIYV